MSSTRRQGGIAEVSARGPSGPAQPVRSSAPNDQAQDEFATILKSLSSAIRPEDVRQREGWRDRQGNIHFVEYIEWHRVADILDQLVPTWSHSVCSIVRFSPEFGDEVPLLLKAGDGCFDFLPASDCIREAYGLGARDDD